MITNRDEVVLLVRLAQILMYNMYPEEGIQFPNSLDEVPLKVMKEGYHGALATRTRL